MAEVQQVVSDEVNKEDRSRGIESLVCHTIYSTWSVLKATGNYLRLRPESDMMDLHLESSLAAVWRTNYTKG